MISLIDSPVTLFNGTALVPNAEKLSPSELKASLAEQGAHYEGALPLASGEGTMARRIAEAHNTDKGEI